MVSKVDTLWLILSSAMVMLMTPGLAFFYGGMVRSKNVLNTLFLSFIALAVVSIEWVLIGFSISFGKDIWGIVGGLNYVFLKDVGLNPSGTYATTVPFLIFMAFQMMFAIITPALMSGAVVERMRSGAYVWFITLWSLLVYYPICHWVWGKGGWFGKIGALDFAGGTVVHINAGVSALVAALFIGKREGYPNPNFIPHNLTLTIIGAGLLWFGWFGFNGGSALEANKTAVLAFVTTHVAAASASFSWILAEWIHRKRPSMLGLVSGLVAGLVAITPASGYVNVLGSMIIGLIAGMVCYFSVFIKMKMGYDDSLDVFGIHGVGGIWGAIATGIFACYGSTGIIMGNVHQLFIQIIATITTIIYSGAVTYLILKILSLFIDLRVKKEEEFIGLDIKLHGEEGYKLM